MRTPNLAPLTTNAINDEDAIKLGWKSTEVGAQVYTAMKVEEARKSARKTKDGGFHEPQKVLFHGAYIEMRLGLNLRLLLNQAGRYDVWP